MGLTFSTLAVCSRIFHSCSSHPCTTYSVALCVVRKTCGSVGKHNHETSHFNGSRHVIVLSLRHKLVISEADTPLLFNAVAALRKWLHTFRSMTVRTIELSAKLVNTILWKRVNWFQCKLSQVVPGHDMKRSTLGVRSQDMRLKVNVTGGRS